MARFTRWSVTGVSSVAALFDLTDTRGIYVLEFDNGEQYVGQTVNIAHRFTSHVHGSKHHKAWQDIVALSFKALPNEDLDTAEYQEIQRRRAKGIKLRNKIFNSGHTEPTPLDEVVTVEQQRHWALGDADYGWDKELLAMATPRFKEPRFRLYQNTYAKGDRKLYNLVLDDLAYVVANVIPSPRTNRRTLLDSFGLSLHSWW
ncbi:hypothetical protein AL705_05415 [Lawsonella clevelandensis]|uniref:GIY-YIG domain-containing protein n=1 Tax=Lawsonella clevelandensis TaxID=1528099 RepID=A0A0M4M8K5_9ACTN|nr:GIY-YIG nuclease family protein [Lawsonella clevelandensis]ALE19126.1 hypothetical protein AL705_05415 [Lawsonella clevelandensis]